MSAEWRVIVHRSPLSTHHSALRIKIQHVLHGVHDIRHLRQSHLFEPAVVGEGDLGLRDAAHGGVEVIKGQLGHARGDFRADAAAV